MLTLIDIIASTVNYVLGIAFISNFYPFRDKLFIRIKRKVRRRCLASKNIYC